MEKFKESKIVNERLTTIISSLTVGEIGCGELLPDQEKYDLTSDILNAVEYINIEHDGEIKERETGKK